MVPTTVTRRAGCKSHVVEGWESLSPGISLIFVNRQHGKTEQTGIYQGNKGPLILPK